MNKVIFKQEPVVQLFLIYHLEKLQINHIFFDDKSSYYDIMMK